MAFEKEIKTFDLKGENWPEYFMDTITAERPKEWNPVGVNLFVGSISPDGKLTSYAIKDMENGTTEIFEKLLAENRDQMPKAERTILEQGKLIALEDYFVPYKAREHSSYLPTCLLPIEGAINVKYDVTVEVLFAEDDGCYRYLEINYQTIGQGSMTMFDYIESFDYKLEEMFEDGQTWGMQKEDSYILTMFKNVSSDIQMEYDSIEEIMSKIVSVRLIKVDCQITN